MSSIVSNAVVSNAFMSWSDQRFDADFGPLNLAMLYKYCLKLNKLLKVFEIMLDLIACVQH